MKKIRELEEEKIINEGLDALVHSFMELIEPCVRKRCEQWFEVIEEALTEKKKKTEINKQLGAKE